MLDPMRNLTACGLSRRDSLAALAGLVITPMALGQAAPSGRKAPGGSAAVQSAAPAALLACWAEAFGSAERIRLRVDSAGRVGIAVDGRTGEGFALVRAFLAAGAVAEALAMVASVSCVPHAFRWAEPAAWPEVCTFTMSAGGPVRLPTRIQLELAAAISARVESHVPFRSDQPASDEAVRGVGANMSSDRVKAWIVEADDRPGFLAAMRVLASVPELAATIGPPSYWQEGTVPVVWGMSRAANPNMLAFVGQRIEAASLYAFQSGASLDPTLLPPETCERAAAANQEVARALATIARLGRCEATEPVVVARVGVPVEARPRAAPPFKMMLGGLAADAPAPGATP
jgi:hypothetical protein